MTTTIASMAFERARFAQTNRDIRQEHDQFILDQLRSCFNLCQIEVGDPFSSCKEELDPSFDPTAHRKRLEYLKMRLRRAAREQWRIIQLSCEWAATGHLVLCWTVARWALMKLEFAGLARRFHVVGVVDVQEACEALSWLIEEDAAELFDVAPNGFEDGR